MDQPAVVDDRHGRPLEAARWECRRSARPSRTVEGRPVPGVSTRSGPFVESPRAVTWQTMTANVSDLTRDYLTVNTAKPATGNSHVDNLTSGHGVLEQRPDQLSPTATRARTNTASGW